MKQIYNWITNKHWNGSDPKVHLFCFRNHYIANKGNETWGGYQIRLFGYTLYDKKKKYY